MQDQQQNSTYQFGSQFVPQYVQFNNLPVPVPKKISKQYNQGSPTLNSGRTPSPSSQSPPPAFNSNIISNQSSFLFASPQSNSASVPGSGANSSSIISSQIQNSSIEYSGSNPNLAQNGSNAIIIQSGSRPIIVQNESNTIIVLSGSNPIFSQCVCNSSNSSSSVMNNDQLIIDGEKIIQGLKIKKQQQQQQQNVDEENNNEVLTDLEREQAQTHAIYNLNIAIQQVLTVNQQKQQQNQDSTSPQSNSVEYDFELVNIGNVNKDSIMNTQQSQTQPDDLEKKWKKTGSQFLEQNQNQYKSEANLEPLNQYTGPAFQLSFVPDPDIYRNTNQDLPRCQSPPLILQRNKDGNKSPNAGRQSPVHQIIDSNQAQQIRVYPSFGQLPPVTKSIYDQIGSQSTGNFTPLGSPNVSPVIQVNKQASPEYALPQELNILENRHCLCSLSRRIMIRPVQAPDGKLYDFKTLVEFLFKNNWIGPDGKKMELKDLIERKDIQQKIIDYVKKNTDAISAKEVNAEDF